jgi:UDP-N-acetylglucosamine 4,6-dehydratase
MFTKIVLERFSPRRLIILSRDELKQYDMQHVFNSKVMRYFIGDVRDRSRLIEAMDGVDYVVHAAALKQVPAAEYNPTECIRTNINGAENVIAAALANQVKAVVALSTDKAVSPCNLYGATKLASDKLFSAANNMVGNRPTRFAVVRYGNVVGSRGSVVPYFRSLIAEGTKRLPITDPDMTRFWITLPQGIDFVLEAFARMHGGEVFVPRIPSVRIVDLARSMAPGMPLEIVGIRPGEKLHESMCPRDEAHNTIRFKDHFVIKPAIRYSFDADYYVDRTGEVGEPVSRGFEYNSGTNEWFMNISQLQQLNTLVA